MLIFTDLELNGVSSLEMADIPPPLPLKGSMADYGNLMENQELISPTTPPAAHQRVSLRGINDFLPVYLQHYTGQEHEVLCNADSRHVCLQMISTATEQCLNQGVKECSGSF